MNDDMQHNAIHIGLLFLSLLGWSSDRSTTMHTQPLTKEQIYANWRSRGYTAAQFARDNGFNYVDVIRVLNGISKARRGIGHRIAVALGMKIEEAAA